MSVERRCEVCGCTHSDSLYEVNGFPIVRCSTCGLVFVGREPNNDELIALYDEAYYESADAPGYASYQVAESRKRLHDRSLLQQLESLQPPGSLLEIGCAYGYFLDEARQRGWSVRGVEPSGYAARHAREHLRLDVTETPFVELPIERESLDTIAMWDVIEHLPHPRQTFERAHAWLRPDGVLAISTGNVGSLAARLHGADWSLMTPPWHQFYFSRGTLRSLLTQTGFAPVRFGGDGSVAIDSASKQPRIRGPLAALLGSSPVQRAARRVGAGSIMFAYARKASR